MEWMVDGGHTLHGLNLLFESIETRAHAIEFFEDFIGFLVLVLEWWILEGLAHLSELRVDGRNRLVDRVAHRGKLFGCLTC